jgi:hypothetical protein
MCSGHAPSGPYRSTSVISVREEPGHITLCFFQSTIGQAADHSAKGQFRFSGLEAALHRGLDALLRLGVEHALAEEIGVAPEVLGRRERDRIDPVLDHDLASGWEPGDPMSERFDEIADRVGRQRSIDPAVLFG